MRATSEEIRAMISPGEDRSNWEAAQAMRQEEVEQLADEDDGPQPEGWESMAFVGLPTDEQRGRFREMLVSVEAEGEASGFADVAEVPAELDRVITDNAPTLRRGRVQK